MKKECIAMLLAGGQGSRLYVLTENMAKPAVPFGGKFRIIDFPLSNCANSGIDTIGVLTQYRPLELNRYIGNGQPWDLDRSDGGVHILPPYQSAKGATWFKGTANAIYQNIGFIQRYNPDIVLILSGDHIYKMDYAAMLRFHESMESDCTIAVRDVPLKEASRFGIMNTDEEGRITEFEEKPKVPRSNKASMGIYIFNWSILKKFLAEDVANPDSSNDFGKNVIPAMIDSGCRMFAWNFSGYWKDVGTIASLWEANMDLLGTNPVFNLYDKEWRIYSKSPIMPPHYAGADAVISNSLVTEGCVVHGLVRHSVLYAGVRIEPGAVVEDSIIMPNSVIERGAVVQKTIVGENAIVGAKARVGCEKLDTDADYDTKLTGDITLVASAVRVADGLRIPKGMVYNCGKGGGFNE